MIKTCGTTTLLKCVGEMISVGRECGLVADVLLYSRKNYVFPECQPHPHNSFESEVHYLDKMFPGKGFTFGDPNKDHWHLYMANLREGSRQPAYYSATTFEVMMHDLHPRVMAQFFKRVDVSVSETTSSSGIAGLLPEGSMIDAFQFEPCGYSMNGAHAGYYYTIHITPEDHCSYVSFETNAPSSLLSYAALLGEVVQVFRPGRVTAVVMAHDDHEEAELFASGYYTEEKFESAFRCGKNVSVYNMVREDGGTMRGKRFIWDKLALAYEEDEAQRMEISSDFSEPEVEDGRSEGDMSEEDICGAAMQ